MRKHSSTPLESVAYSFREGALFQRESLRNQEEVILIFQLAVCHPEHNHRFQFFSGNRFHQIRPQVGSRKVEQRRILNRCWRDCVPTAYVHLNGNSCASDQGSYADANAPVLRVFPD